MTTPVPMRFADSPLLWLVDDVYSAAECEQFIANIEHWGADIATNNPLYRNQDRVMRDDPDTAADLFARLKPHLPGQMGELALLKLNDRLRYYRYSPGQEFKEHMDHWYQPCETDVTLLTVLVYFNGDYEGGQTRFTEQLEQTVQPASGQVAIFQHKIRHEGCRVLTGSKYAMRSDVIYRAPSPVQLTYKD